MPSRPVPTTASEFQAWAQSERLDGFFDYDPNRHSSLLNDAERQILRSAQFTQLRDLLRASASKYRIQTKSDLFVSSSEVPLVQKGYPETLEKCFRKNVLRNEEFPNPPEGGWITPANWLGRIADLLRGQLVVRFVDGVKMLSEEISNALQDVFTLTPTVDFESRFSGYYACHVGLPFEVTLPYWNASNPWRDYRSETIWIEIQIRTNMQESLWHLTHKFYEADRLNSRPEEVAWNYETRADQFSATYLSHLVHYADVEILRLRNG